MSEALQCNRCKKYAIQQYDIATDKYVGTEGWLKLFSQFNYQRNGSIGNYCGDLCKECVEEFKGFIGYPNE